MKSLHHYNLENNDHAFNLDKENCSSTLRPGLKTFTCINVLSVIFLKTELTILQQPNIDRAS